MGDSVAEEMKLKRINSQELIYHAVAINKTKRSRAYKIIKEFEGYQPSL